MNSDGDIDCKLLAVCFSKRKSNLSPLQTQHAVIRLRLNENPVTTKIEDRGEAEQKVIEYLEILNSIKWFWQNPSQNFQVAQLFEGVWMSQKVSLFLLSPRDRQQLSSRYTSQHGAGSCDIVTVNLIKLLTCCWHRGSSRRGSARWCSAALAACSCRPGC